MCKYPPWSCNPIIRTGTHTNISVIPWHCQRFRLFFGGGMGWTIQSFSLIAQFKSLFHILEDANGILCFGNGGIDETTTTGILRSQCGVRRDGTNSGGRTVIMLGSGALSFGFFVNIRANWVFFWGRGCSLSILVLLQILLVTRIVLLLLGKNLETRIRMTIRMLLFLFLAHGERKSH